MSRWTYFFNEIIEIPQQYVEDRDKMVIVKNENDEINKENHNLNDSLTITIPNKKKLIKKKHQKRAMFAQTNRSLSKYLC